MNRIEATWSQVVHYLSERYNQYEEESFRREKNDRLARLEELRRIPQQLRLNPPSPFENLVLKIFTPRQGLPLIAPQLDSKYNIPFALTSFTLAASSAALGLRHFSNSQVLGALSLLNPSKLSLKCFMAVGLGTVILSELLLFSHFHTRLLIKNTFHALQSFPRDLLTKHHPEQLKRMARALVLSSFAQSANYAQFSFATEVERSHPYSIPHLQNIWRDFLNYAQPICQSLNDPIEQSMSIVHSLNQRFRIDDPQNYDPDQDNMSAFLMGKKGNCIARAWIIISALQQSGIEFGQRYHLGVQDFGKNTRLNNAHIQAVIYDQQTHRVLDLLTGEWSEPDVIKGPVFEPNILPWAYLNGDSREVDFIFEHPAQNYLIVKATGPLLQNNADIITSRSSETHLYTFPSEDNISEYQSEASNNQQVSSNDQIENLGNFSAQDQVLLQAFLAVQNLEGYERFIHYHPEWSQHLKTWNVEELPSNVINKFSRLFAEYFSNLGNEDLYNNFVRFNLEKELPFRMNFSSEIRNRSILISNELKHHVNDEILHLYEQSLTQIAAYRSVRFVNLFEISDGMMPEDVEMGSIRLSNERSSVIVARLRDFLRAERMEDSYLYLTQPFRPSARMLNNNPQLKLQAVRFLRTALLSEAVIQNPELLEQVRQSLIRLDRRFLN